MTSNGKVKYEMRFPFNRCQGEKPASFGAEESGVDGVWVGSGFFIKRSLFAYFKSYFKTTKPSKATAMPLLNLTSAQLLTNHP
jgi:hypothetical protein